MGRKSKPFINKKEASTYHLVRRSQRDVGREDEEATSESLSQFVLMPSPNNAVQNHVISEDAPFLPPSNKKTTTTTKEKEEDGGGGFLSTLEQKLSHLGNGALLDDSDRVMEKYTKSIDGSGIYINSSGKVEHNTGGSSYSAKHKPPPSNNTNIMANYGPGDEVERQYESIALNANCMDRDVAEVLFGEWDDSDLGQDGLFEEILDDFCITAAEEPQLEDAAGGNEIGGGAFDYDAHIRHLMERARSERDNDDGVTGDDHEWMKQDSNFFAGAKSVPARDQDDNDDSDDDDSFAEVQTTMSTVMEGVVPKLSADAERALCEKFEATLAEYDSDEVGELYEVCDVIGGEEPLEENPKLEHVWDSFITSKNDDVLMEGTRNNPEYRRTGGSSYVVLHGKELVQIDNFNGEENPPEEEGIDKVLQDADRILANPEMEPPEEDVLIDGKSYYSEGTRNPWDCETILSTYSNMDNNPVTIGRSTRRKNKKKHDNKVQFQNVKEDDEEEEQITRIELSNKTGLPIGVLPQKQLIDDDDDINDEFSRVSVNKGVPRKKNETPEEKKARKQAIKDEKQIKRMEKQIMKQAFAEEFDKRAAKKDTDDVAGLTVFRYS